MLTPLTMRADIDLQAALHLQPYLTVTAPSMLVETPTTTMAAHGIAAVVAITSTALAPMDTMAI